MAHRVLQSQARGNDQATEQQVKDLKNEILDRFTSPGYDTHQLAINDGQNENGDYTIGIVVDFNVVNEANEFHDWLKAKLQDRQDLLEFARTQVHDCMHAANPEANQPCVRGDVWSYGTP